MPAIKVGLREFRGIGSRYLESETPVAGARRGETPGLTLLPRKPVQPAEIGELKPAADLLAEALSDTGEECRRRFQDTCE